MDNPTVKNIIGAILGIIVAVVVVGLVEMAGHTIFPPPEGLDITNPEDQARLMEVIPTGAKVAVMVAWFIGSFAGIFAARKIGATSWPSWLVTALMIAASVYTTTLFPHPIWMVAGALLLPIAALLLAGRMIPLPKP